MKDERKQGSNPAVNQDTKSSPCSCIDGSTAHHGQTQQSQIATNQLKAFFPNSKTSQRRGTDESALTERALS